MTEADKKADLKVQEVFEVQWVLYIYYSVQFNEFSVEVLINSDSKINAI